MEWILVVLTVMGHPSIDSAALRFASKDQCLVEAERLRAVLRKAVDPNRMVVTACLPAPSLPG